MVRAGFSALLAIALLAIAGCGDSEESASTVTETYTVSSSAETTAEDASTTETTTETPDGETPPADETVTKLTAFKSPTGNIGCMIDRESVRCDIADRDWEPPPAPRDCKLDYGQGIQLTAGGTADLVCAGDTTLGEGSPLPYGQSIASGLLRCESEEAGMTCRDIETGRGFTIAKDSYELF